MLSIANIEANKERVKLTLKFEHHNNTGTIEFTIKDLDAIVDWYEIYHDDNETVNTKALPLLANAILSDLNIKL